MEALNLVTIYLCYLEVSYNFEGRHKKKLVMLLMVTLILVTKPVFFDVFFSPFSQKSWIFIMILNMLGVFFCVCNF